MKTLYIAIIMLFAMQLNAGEHHTTEKKQLITPTIWAVSNTMFACNLTNVDTKAHQVQVRIISNGKVLLESKSLTVKPRHTTNHKTKGLPNGGGPIYCEFTIEGDEDDFRGVAVLYHGPSGSDFVAVPAW